MAKSKPKIPYKYIACCFQGGGALGAYQVGVLRALDEAGYYPNWFAGTSIGAINAAIAAGNPPKERVKKMYAFWKEISTADYFSPLSLPDDEESRRLQHYFSAQHTLLFGQPGFFMPRFPPLPLGYYDRPDTLSYYDTCQLKSTLERYVDFDRLNNAKETRISIGAVEICSGDMVYFDSLKEEIGPEHIMASGALPPGFPAIEIEGKFYWDGGISSNAPANYVLSTNECPRTLLCFTVHLFDSYGLYPKTLDDVLRRKKDIEFSSRYCQMINLYQQIHALKNSIHVLSQYVSETHKKKEIVKECIVKGFESNVCLVRFMYRHDETEFSSKDYEFSSKSIQERIRNGYRDGKKAIHKSPWLNLMEDDKGIEVYDMSPSHFLKESDDE